VELKLLVGHPPTRVGILLREEAIPAEAANNLNVGVPVPADLNANRQGRGFKRWASIGQPFAKFSPTGKV